MEAVKFKGHNVVFAESQDEYNSLPAHWDGESGVVVTAWQMNEEETKKFIETGVIYLQQLTFNNPLQPLLPSVDNPFDLAI